MLFLWAESEKGFGHKESFLDILEEPGRLLLVSLFLVDSGCSHKVTERQFAEATVLSFGSMKVYDKSRKKLLSPTLSVVGRTFP